jgi:hypothetical protein
LALFVGAHSHQISILYSFGYVVEGADFLSDTKEDDVIVSAKITSGKEFLVLPKSDTTVPF